MIDRHLVPPVARCHLVDGQMACQSCHQWAYLGAWTWGGDSMVACPACAARQKIPRYDDWRIGTCEVDITLTQITPFRGQCGCDRFEPHAVAVVAVAAKPDPQRSLF